MWKTSWPMLCGKPAACCAASSAETSSTHASGSACAPLPCKSSTRTWDIAGTSCYACCRDFAVRWFHHKRNNVTRRETWILASREIFFLQNAAMMEFVASNGISDGAHADLVFVGDAAAKPCRFVEIAQQSQGGPANGDVVVDQFRKWATVERPVAHIVVLLEAFDGRAVAARDTQGAISEDTLGVADMAEHLFGGPLVGGVTEVAVGLVASREEKHHLAALGIERAEDVGSGNQ